MQLNKLSIHWTPQALWIFYQLPIHTATAIDRAVIHFANTSEGRVEIIAPHYALRVGAYRIPFVIDLDARTLNIIRIYRVTF